MSRQAPPGGHTSLSTPRIVTNPWLMLIVLTLGFFMILLDTTIVNVAIPTITADLHASLDQILWVLNAYILVYAVLLITAGRLGDMIGPRRLFMIGLTLFVLASAACGFSQDAHQLIAFRVIQGIGGAILTPQTLTMITSIFPPEKRGAAFGVWGAVAGLAAVAGPTLGGLLTTEISWRAIFYVNLPIGIITMVLAFLFLPELTVHRKHRLDVVGILLASGGLFALVFGLIEGQRFQWGRINDFGAFSIGSLQASVISIPTILAAAVIVLAVFIFWEARQEEPLLPLSLFRDRNFSVANSVSAIITFAMFGMFLPLTIFLQSVLGLDALHAGFVFAPMTLTSALVAPWAGRLVDRIGGKWIQTFGLAMFAAGFGTVIAVASLDSTGLTFTIPLILAGIGMGCTFAPLTTMAMMGVPPTQAGAASGFLNTTRQVGGSIGLAVIGAVLQYRLANELRDQAVKWAATAKPPLKPDVRNVFLEIFSRSSGGLEVGRGQTGLSGLPKNLPHPVLRDVQAAGQQLQVLFREVFQHAYLLAFKPSLAISIVGLFLGVATTLLMRGRKTDAGAQRQERPRGIAATGE